MEQDSSKMKTPKAPRSATTAAASKHKMAEATHEADSPISLKTLRAELQSYREALVGDIKSQIETLHQEIKKEISSLREEAKADLRALRTELIHEQTALQKTQAEMMNEQADMGQVLSDTMDRVATLEQAREKMEKEYKRTYEKCMDLENRSRRQNLKIIGIAEGTEAGHPTRFAAEFFPEILGAEHFGGSPVVIDRAHRSLAPKPKKGERPRAIVVRLHYYSDKEKILSLSRNKGRLLYKGTPVHIFPDMSPEVAKLRAAFNPVKARLRDAGINYSLFYPARLTVTVDDARHTFESPREAEDFLNKTLPSTVESS